MWVLIYAEDDDCEVFRGSRCLLLLRIVSWSVQITLTDTSEISKKRKKSRVRSVPVMSKVPYTIGKQSCVLVP